MNNNYTPRFSFEITEAQQLRANRVLHRHGIRKAVMSIILDDVLDLVEEHGEIIIGIICDKGTKPREIIPSLAQAEADAEVVKEAKEKEFDKHTSTFRDDMELL